MGKALQPSKCRKPPEDWQWGSGGYPQKQVERTAGVLALLLDSISRLSGLKQMFIFPCIKCPGQAGRGKGGHGKSPCALCPGESERSMLFCSPSAKLLSVVPRQLAEARSEFPPHSKPSFYCNSWSKWAGCMISPFWSGHLCSPPLFWDIHLGTVNISCAIWPVNYVLILRNYKQILGFLSSSLWRGSRKSFFYRVSWPVFFLPGARRTAALFHSQLRALGQPESPFCRIGHSYWDTQATREKGRSHTQSLP